MTRLMVGLAVLASMGAAVPATAQDFEQVSATVKTSDLDLSSADGQRALQKRIAKKADRLCRSGANVTFVTGSEDLCRAQVMASAEGQVKQQVALAEARSKARRG